MIIDTSLVYVDNEFIFKEPKSDSGERTLIMPDSLIAILKEHSKNQNINKLSLGKQYENNDLVCCREDGRPIIPGSFSYSFSAFLKEHDLKKIRPFNHRHYSKLIHTFISGIRVRSHRQDRNGNILGTSNIIIYAKHYSLYRFYSSIKSI